jgi:CheY-like chemotaxis protein
VKSRVVLIVDDMAINRQGTTLAVQGFGFETNEAEDGFMALAKVKTTAYAAILMDCQMPRLDGFECTAQIRELEKLTGSRTPIIGMTASTDRDIREACLNAGMDDYIDKSCSNTELQQILEKWLLNTVSDS